jgi:hypothetical protein
MKVIGLTRLEELRIVVRKIKELTKNLIGFDRGYNSVD